MKTVYYTNSHLGDTKGAGLTVACYLLNDDGSFASTVMVGEDGKPFLGYMAKEITEKEFLEWKERIANPDYKKYFPSMFGGIGIINKKARETLDAKIAEAKQAYCEKQCEAQRINFKLAQRDAEAIGEDHEAVFTSKHPQVSEDVKAMLFAEVRAAQAKAVKKKAK
jgi:hypothetical protein